MKPKLLTLLLFSLGLVSRMVLPAAGAQANTMNVCIGPTVETLDPSLVYTSDNATYVLHLFEGLMKPQPVEITAGQDLCQDIGWDVVPGQAASYELSEDGLIYTFYLRDDIFWSDGMPVTAEDFVYSWKRLMDPKTEATNRFLLCGIVENASAISSGEANPETLGITALDDSTLQIKLETPYVPFLSLCASVSLVPLRKDIISGYNTDWTDSSHIVTNGPYILASKENAQEKGPNKTRGCLRMVRNPGYYSPVSGPDTINFYYELTENNSEKYDSEVEYDFYLSPAPDKINMLFATGEAHILPVHGTHYLLYNAKRINDWRVRAAISLVIDREYLSNNIAKGQQLPAEGLVSPDVSFPTGSAWEKTYPHMIIKALQEKYPEYDLSSYFDRCDLATSLINEAISDGSQIPGSLTLLCRESDTVEELTAMIQVDITAVLDIAIVPDIYDDEKYSEHVSDRDFDLLWADFFPPCDDAGMFLKAFSQTNFINFGRWQNKEYCQILEDAYNCPDTSEKENLLATAEQLFFDENGFPIVPVFYNKPICYAKHHITGIGHTASDCYLFMYAQITE